MTTLTRESTMTSRLFGGLAPQNPSLAGVAHPDGAPPAVAPFSKALIGNSIGEPRVDLMNLQKLVCELLFKNQQLRMALSEATRKPEGTVAQTE